MSSGPVVRLALRAEELGIHGGLVPCPFYFPNSFPMVLEFFKALDRETSLGLVLYDNPLYTKAFLRTQEIMSPPTKPISPITFSKAQQA